MNTLLIFSIILELAVAVLGLLIWLQKKQQYGLCIFITFTIYILYDISRNWPFGISETALRILFAIASLSILWGVWDIYKSK